MPTRKEAQRSARARFVDIAADMEMGYYLDPSGHQWDARPFLIGEILRSMGYGEDNISRGIYPAWWPGQADMRRIVALKVLLRQAQSRPGAGHPWLDPLLAASVETLLDRLYSDPGEVRTGDLVDLTTKLSRIQAEQRRSGAFASPGQVAEGQALAYQKVTETILQLPAEEQEIARKRLDTVTQKMLDRLSVPAGAE